MRVGCHHHPCSCFARLPCHLWEPVLGFQAKYHPSPAKMCAQSLVQLLLLNMCCDKRCTLLYLALTASAAAQPGPGAFDFIQGDTTGNPFWNLVRDFLSPPSQQQQACQAPKPILLNTGAIKQPYPWQPDVTEASVMRLGNFVSGAAACSLLAFRQTSCHILGKSTACKLCGLAALNDQGGAVQVRGEQTKASDGQCKGRGLCQPATAGSPGCSLAPVSV